MPKVTVYLPDDLYREARTRGLPISTLAQEALQAALRRGRTDQWIARVRARPTRLDRAIDTSAAVADVREEFGS
jgi:post-segregation antitoxin (ccd killing protein)